MLMASVVVAARSPWLLPERLTELPHAVKVTSPVVPAFGVQSTVNVAWFDASLFFGLLWVASATPAIVLVCAEAAPPMANVPGWLERMLKPAAIWTATFWLVTTKVSVICWPGVSDVALADSATSGGTA